MAHIIIFIFYLFTYLCFSCLQAAKLGMGTIFLEDVGSVKRSKSYPVEMFYSILFYFASAHTLFSWKQKKEFLMILEQPLLRR